MLFTEKELVGKGVCPCLLCDKFERRFKFDTEHRDIVHIYEKPVISSNRKDLFACACGDKKNKETCREYLHLAIREIKPKLIIVHDMSSLKQIIGDEHKGKYERSRWRGFIFPAYKFNCWCGVVEQPVPDDKLVELQHKQQQIDVKKFKTYLYKVLPPNPKNENFVHLMSPVKAKKFLDQIITKKPMIAIDYETTGLKPFRAGHKIVSCAIAVNDHFSGAFMMEDSLIEPLVKILEDQKIHKIAANMAYEILWSMVILNARPKGFVFDTMIAQHILDHRQAICGLKHMAMVHLGVLEYDDATKHWLRCEQEEGEKYATNGINQIHKVPKKELLTYNAYDSLFEYILATQLKKQIMGVGNERSI